MYERNFVSLQKKDMVKIILFSNTKGGTGKSTLCMHFATYLAQKGYSIAVLDADSQQSITDLRHRELITNPDAEIPWKDWNASENTEEFMKRAKSLDKGYILIDCPGSISPSLLPLFKSADAIIIPFRYDDLVADSTINFVKVLRHLNITARMLFLPNCIDLRIKYANEDSIKDLLRRLGSILPRVKQGVAIQRVSTIDQDQYQRMAVMYAVEEALNIISKIS